MNLLDYGARNYDPNIGRWFTPDPLASIYSNFSPYMFCGGNSIRYVDPNGMAFTSAMEGWVFRLNSQINAQKMHNESAIRNKTDRMNAASGDKKRLGAEIAALKSKNDDLGNAADEINVLRGSNQMYDVLNDNSLNTEGATIAGFQFNFTNGYAEILMPNNDLGLFAHELKHAYQFEIGALSSGNKTFGVIFYDQVDEHEAYRRMESLNLGIYNPYTITSEYGHLPKKQIDAANHPNIQHLRNYPEKLQEIANRGIAFRIDGKTYYQK